MLSIRQTIEQMNAKKMAADQPIEHCLAAIDIHNPQINAFVEVIHTIQPQKNTQGPLSNIPIAIKDLMDVRGLPTRAGSPKFFGPAPAEQNAYVVEKLTAAGAKIIGKTHTHEIALGITGINPHYGPVRNPHRPSHISGGSSSGSAAALAAGMCFGALGTDTGGSIRIPAALCGVVGLKPTRGRVSTRGVIPLSWTLDHVGPLARCVEDVALLLQVIAGYDPADLASVQQPVDDYQRTLKDGVQGWRLAVLSGESLAGSDPNLLAVVEQAVQVFAELGASLHRVDLPQVQQAAQANTQIILSDAAAFHRERLAEHPNWFGPDVRKRLETGRSLSGSDVSLARHTQSQLIRFFELFFGEYDLLLLPTTAIPAIPIDGTESAEYAPRLTRFTAPFNLLGLPALSIPCGNVDGLPVGLQIVGPAWSEAKILRAGFAVEAGIKQRQKT